MASMTYIGLDIHKKTISYCVKDVSGKVLSDGKINATRQGLDDWMKRLTRPWTVAMEATMFTGWIYDYLRPHAAAVKVAHPLMLRAIAVAKKKNDRIDADKIADCLRCDFLPECYMAPMEIRQRRRTLRYRKLLVRQNVQLKNKIAQMLMESGVSYNKDKLHQQGYFHQVLPSNPEIDASLWPLLKLSREMIERTQKTERALLRSLEADPLLAARVDRLMTIPCDRPRHGADLGARSRRGRAVPLRQAGHQLLRPVQWREDLGRQFQAHAHLQAAQSTLAVGAVGGRASGSETQPGAGRSLRARSGAEQPQPGCDRRCPQAGSVPPAVVACEDPSFGKRGDGILVSAKLPA